MSLDKIDYKVTCGCGTRDVTRYVVECDFCGKRYNEKCKGKETPDEAFKAALAGGFSFDRGEGFLGDMWACGDEKCMKKFDEEMRRRGEYAKYCEEN